MSTTVGWMILETAGLSFLGLGSQPPQADLALAGGDVLVLRGGKPQIEQAERHLLLGEVLPAA